MLVSVIIPARNAAATLERTLEAVMAQDLEEPYEVVVVDDNSTDETARIVSEAPGVTMTRNAGPPFAGAARNSGAGAATGAILAFTDSDCYPRPDWLRRGVAAIAGVDLLQGAVQPDPSVRPMPFDRSVWVVAEVGLYETANLFVRRAAFDAVGGFEDWRAVQTGRPLAEDVWLGWRLRRSGATTSFSQDTLVYHEVFRRGFLEYASERFRLRYFPEIVQKMPELRKSLLFGRVFLSKRTAAFDLALAGVASATVTGSPWLLLALLPYGWSAVRRARPWGRLAPKVALGEGIADLVGAAALLAGSMRRRAIVL